MRILPARWEEPLHLGYTILSSGALAIFQALKVRDGVLLAARLAESGYPHDFGT